MTDLGDYSELVNALDLPAKVRLLTGASMFTLWPAEEIGLDALAFSDGPTGVRGLQFIGGPPACLMPNATLVSSSWDEDVAHLAGQILAEEAERQHIHLVLGPTINLHRSPLGGRLFEAYSEDPLLTGRIAAAYTKGLQDNGVGACLKHLVANESETERNFVNSEVDEATLRELYLLPFEIAVEQADPWAIMAAYNDVNGVPATEHQHIINEIVKGEWGYRGLIVSDWFATKTAAAAANGGLDLVMPGPAGPWGAQLVDAVRSGRVGAAVIDEHLTRVLHLADRAGALGRARSWRADVPAADAPLRREQLTRLAAAGMTVLTNTGVLPLAADASVALIGRHATDTLTMGGGSAQVNPPHQVSIAQGLACVLGERLQVCDGVEVRRRPMPARPDTVREPGSGRPGVGLVLHAADGRELDRRLAEVSSALVGMDDQLSEPVAEAILSCCFDAAGPMQIGVIGVGSWVLSVGGRRFTVTLDSDDRDPGAPILKPPVWSTEVVLEGRCELHATVTGAPAVFGQYGLVVNPAARAVPEVLAEAAASARGADVAVVVVGLTAEQETEASDKSTLRLPGAQDELVTTVASAARHTVVVVNAATPVLMPWLDRVDAVLWAGLPGQEAGHAVAAALLGTIEPAGRLVTSFPVADSASPAWSVTPVDATLRYVERTAIGYRGYAARAAPAPQFWFGHGLGYGSWGYSGARLLRNGTATPTVQVMIRNGGVRTSREVVQVYLQPTAQDQPVRLVGWAAATVEPGQSATVDVSCDERMWRRWDTERDCWQRMRGGELIVARGLGDVRARLSLSEWESV